MPVKYTRSIQIQYLYNLNKGALIQNGFSLPIILEHNGIGSKRKLRNYLRRTGSEVVYSPEDGFQYRLIVSIQEHDYSWYLLDREGEISFEAEGSFEKLNNTVYKEIVMSFFETVYSYDF